MKVRASNYPIGKLLLTIIENSGLRPFVFFKEIGYGNPNSGFNNLDTFLLRGEGFVSLINMIQASKYAVEQSEFEEALVTTKQIIAEEKEKIRLEFAQKGREQFIPYISIIPELKRPTQITLFCLTGGNDRYNTYIDKMLLEHSEEQQYASVKELIVENFSRHSARTLFMGAIVGYLYHYSFDEQPICFTTEGNVAEVQIKHPIYSSYVEIR